MAEPRFALDKVAFLMAFVPYLGDRDEPVSVAEAARHFGTTEEFVRRAAVQLTMTGLPGESGVGLSFDLFDIDYDALESRDELVLTNRIAIDDVPRLSSREAAAVIAGLEIIGQDPVIAASPYFATLRAKLVRGAAAEPDAPAVGVQTVPYFAELRQAIAERRRVAFRYRAAGAPTAEQREVDPLRIEAIDASYHLRAWCHVRGGFRTFRLDRIDGLELLDTPTAHDASELDQAATGFTPSDEHPIVTIEFDAAGIDLVEGYRPESLEVDKASGRATMRVAVSSAVIVRRLLAETPGARVVGPEEARSAVREWAADAVGRYVTRDR